MRWCEILHERVHAHVLTSKTKSSTHVEADSVAALPLSSSAALEPSSTP